MLHTFLTEHLRCKKKFLSNFEACYPIIEVGHLGGISSKIDKSDRILRNPTKSGNFLFEDFQKKCKFFKTTSEFKQKAQQAEMEKWYFLEAV